MPNYGTANYIGNIKKKNRLDEVLSPEEQEMRDWEYGESLAPTREVDLGRINVTRKIANQPVRLGQQVGSGLWKFISALGKSVTGTPISMEGRGWESYLGGDIGAKLGAGIVGGALFGPETGQKLAAAATPTLYETPETKAKENVFGTMAVDEYNLLQQELTTIPEATLTNPQLAMPLYRALLLKYPSAKSFLAEYFGLTRNYNYNFPQGLPTGKYNLGGPVVGTE